MVTTSKVTGLEKTFAQMFLKYDTGVIVLVASCLKVLKAAKAVYLPAMIHCKSTYL